MDLVVGDGPLARALASALGTSGSAVLLGPRPLAGRFLWREGDPLTGEGVAEAMAEARRAFVVIDEDLPNTRALFAAIPQAAVARGVLVLPLGAELPKGARRLTDWSVVRVGPTWGPEEPLVASWATTLARGGFVWLADPGPIPALSMADAVAGIRAAAGFRGQRWTLVSDEGHHLPELVETLAHGLGVSPKALPGSLAWVAKHAGIGLERLQRWLRPVDEVWHTPGWTPRGLVGPAGWLGDPEQWRHRRSS